MSRRKRTRRVAAWVRYERRFDRLVAGQPLTHDLCAPIRTNPGFFRAEGWNTDRYSLRHGA